MSLHHNQRNQRKDQRMDKIKGFHLTQEQEEASQELDTVVEEMLITLRLSGQKQLYCFDVTNDPAVRNAVLASLGDDYDDQAEEEN